MFFPKLEIISLIGRAFEKIERVQKNLHLRRSISWVTMTSDAIWLPIASKRCRCLSCSCIPSYQYLHSDDTTTPIKLFSKNIKIAGEALTKERQRERERGRESVQLRWQYSWNNVAQFEPPCPVIWSLETCAWHFGTTLWSYCTIWPHYMGHNVLNQVFVPGPHNRVPVLG